MRGIVTNRLPDQSESRSLSKAPAIECKYLTFTTDMPTTSLLLSRERKYNHRTLQGIIMEGSNVYKESSVDPELNGSGDQNKHAENTQPCTISSIQMAVLSLRALQNVLEYDTRSFKDLCIEYFESVLADIVWALQSSNPVSCKLACILHVSYCSLPPQIEERTRQYNLNVNHLTITQPLVLFPPSILYH